MFEMRTSLPALAALMLGGCLYVGDVNDRPSVSMHALFTSKTTLGAPITLTARVDDDQSQAKVSLRVRDSSGTIIDDPCIVGITDVTQPSDVDFSFAVTIWQAGVYNVEGTPTDQLGASGSSASVQINVEDAAPVFGPDSFGVSGALRAASAPTACTALYPTGQPIPITLEGSITDAEESWTPPPAACAVRSAAPLVKTWHIVSRPSGSGAALGRSSAGHCPDTPVDGAVDLVDDHTTVCLYPDPSLPTATPSMYTIALEVSDGTSTVRTDNLAIPVIGEAPACLDGSYPAVGSYVLDRSLASVFQAVGVDDVSKASTLEFVWTLRRPGATSFDAIAALSSAEDGGNRLVFDPVALGLQVGDDVELRVEVRDPNGSAIACADDDDTCAAASCAAAPAATCPRRATWSLEIR